MFQRGKIKALDDLLVSLPQRAQPCAYFVRINSYSDETFRFLQQYFVLAQRNGVLVDGKLQNPNESNLTYYYDRMGDHFEFSLSFVEQSLSKWMPRVQLRQQKELAQAIFEELQEQRRQGKTESILKNTYVKFFCWLYGKFDRLSSRLGTDDLPRILYEGQISRHEMQMLKILNRVGCDIVLIQKNGDGEYMKLDAASAISEAYADPRGTAFPMDFSLAKLNQPKAAAPRAMSSGMSARSSEPVRSADTAMRSPTSAGNPNLIPRNAGSPAVRSSTPSAPERQLNVEIPPKKSVCINAWPQMTGKPLEDIQVPVSTRCEDSRFIGTVFVRINGVEDKLTYQSELHTLHQNLLAAKRKVVILEGSIELPRPDETQKLRRRNYRTAEEAIIDLRLNISAGANAVLQNMMQCAFTNVMVQISRQQDMNLNRLTNIALHLLCWLKRYQDMLFDRWQSPEAACLILLGAVGNEKEIWFLRMMAHMPVDVLLLHPNLDEACLMADESLLDIHYFESLAVDRFPTGDASIGTAAYHASRELDTLMYQDTGMYRDRQYSQAESIALRTTYDEIAQLWDLDLKYRPNYSTANGIVNIPVIFARVSGVKDGNTDSYWSSIKKLMTDHTKTITALPYLTGTDPNPIASSATDFYQRGKLMRDKIRTHRNYPFALLREETQNYLLDKLQMMLDRKMIQGIGVNGTEYKVISTILNLQKDVQRLIQQFDFTKKNPKLLIVNARETTASLEDAILIVFLHLIGFDIAMFIPTGYQCVERWLATDVLDEHQAGEYLYDLTVPDFQTVSVRSHNAWTNIFRRG